MFSCAFSVPGLLCRPERGVHFRYGVLLHSRKDVRIEVERYPDLGVPQALTGDLRMDAGSQHMGGVGVPQVMEANAGRSVSSITRTHSWVMNVGCIMVPSSSAATNDSSVILTPSLSMSSDCFSL